MGFALGTSPTAGTLSKLGKVAKMPFTYFLKVFFFFFFSRYSTLLLPLFAFVLHRAVDATVRVVVAPLVTTTTAALPLSIAVVSALAFYDFCVLKENQIFSSF